LLTGRPRASGVFAGTSVSDPTPPLGLDLARRQIEAWTVCPTLVTCRTGPRSAALIYLSRGSAAATVRGWPGEVVLEVAGRELRITSPDKVFFSERGETKLDLVRYYLAVAEPLMRAAGGRPTLMQRFPHGAEGSSFFQKRVPESRPDWLETTIVSTPNGTTSRALVLADTAHVRLGREPRLPRLPRLAVPGRAPRGHRRAAPRPRPAAGRRLRRHPRRGAELRALLDELGIVGYPKTTGNRGLHVYVRLEPRWDSYQVRAAAVAAARELERAARADHGGVVEGGARPPRLRRLQPERAAQDRLRRVVGARRAGAQVSAPLTWDEVDALHPDELTIATVPERLAANGDPWEGMNASRSRSSRCSSCTSATARPG
jgi:DNA primase